MKRNMNENCFSNMCAHIFIWLSLNIILCVWVIVYVYFRNMSLTICVWWIVLNGCAARRMRLEDSMQQVFWRWKLFLILSKYSPSFLSRLQETLFYWSFFDYDKNSIDFTLQQKKFWTRTSFWANNTKWKQQVATTSVSS